MKRENKEKGEGLFMGKRVTRSRENYGERRPNMFARRGGGGPNYQMLIWERYMGGKYHGRPPDRTFKPPRVKKIERVPILTNKDESLDKRTKSKGR